MAADLSEDRGGMLPPRFEQFVQIGNHFAKARLSSVECLGVRRLVKPAIYVIVDAGHRRQVVDPEFRAHFRDFGERGRVCVL